MALTLSQMQDIINGGGSVMFGNQVLSTLASLPSTPQIDAANQAAFLATLTEKESLILSISDETTDIVANTSVFTFRVPFAMELLDAKASVNTAPTGTSIIVDVNEDGTTILSTKLTIGIGAETSDANPLAATGTVTLDSGASGSVDGITVDGDEVMSGVENFDTDLDTTAGNVAANITANTSTPNYIANAVGAVITITASDKGVGANGFVVVSSVTTIATTDVNMADGVDAVVISDTSLAEDAEITVDIDQIGSGTAGKGLKLILEGYRT